MDSSIIEIEKESKRLGDKDFEEKYREAESE